MHVSCYREGWVPGRAERPPRIRVLLLPLLLPAPDGVIPAGSGRRQFKEKDGGDVAGQQGGGGACVLAPNLDSAPHGQVSSCARDFPHP